MNTEFNTLKSEVGKFFTPNTPISSEALFSGRTHQIEQAIDAINEKGKHIVIYGERGVGKTSLSKIILARNSNSIVFYVSCNRGDDYSSLWRKTLGQLLLQKSIDSIGFIKNISMTTESALTSIPADITTDTVNYLVRNISQEKKVIIIFDEFDSTKNMDISALMSDTIKLFSDTDTNASIILVGVAASIQELISNHNSIERITTQISMPRMRKNEIKGIVTTGLNSLNMKIENDTLEQIIILSQGLPWVAHSLCLFSSKASIDELSKTVTMKHLEIGIKKHLDNCEQTYKAAYNQAINSIHPDNIYKEVLLSCSLAIRDESYTFAAKDVKLVLDIITKKNNSISGFTRHLGEFIRPERGSLIKKISHGKRFRYAFNNPSILNYITIKSLANNIVNIEHMNRIIDAQKNSTAYNMSQLDFGE